jgi:hypothetical protein
VKLSWDEFGAWWTFQMHTWGAQWEGPVYVGDYSEITQSAETKIAE